MTPVRLEPAALRSRVKHSTTEPLRSLRLPNITDKLSIEANSMDPEQTAPIGSTLFAIEASDEKSRRLLL